MHLPAKVIQKQIEAMDHEGLDASVAISPENFAYTTGLVVPSQTLMRWRHAAAIVTRDGRAAVLAVDMEEATVKNHLPDVDVYTWSEFNRDAMPALARLVEDLGLTEATVGIETDYLPANDWEALTAHLPKTAWAPNQHLLNRARMHKTQEEVSLLGWLSGITEEAIAVGFKRVKAGNTELDLAASVVAELYRRGVDSHKLLIVASGERSQFPNVGPTNRVLRGGDVIRLEVFGVSNGYHAGICRTAVVQEAKPEIMRVWENLLECRSIVLDAIYPGADAATVYERFLSKFSELGYRPIDFVGHGIGLYLHEEPYLGPHSGYRLEEGMVFGVEPLVYAPGSFGVQMKDMVAVSPEGCWLLSDRMDLTKPVNIP